MLALYIILGILLFLFLLTLLNIWVYADYYDELRLSVRIAFIKLRLVPPKEKKKKKKKAPAKKKTETKPAEQKKKPSKIKALLKEKGVSGILNIVKQIALLAAGTLKDLFSKITVTNLFLNIRIAGSDAADTAVKYGQLCAVLYPALNVIYGVFTVKKYEVNINPDFSDKPESSVKAEVKAKIRIISLIWLVIKRGVQALKLYLKLKTKNENTKENEK